MKWHLVFLRNIILKNIAGVASIALIARAAVAKSRERFSNYINCDYKCCNNLSVAVQ